MNDDTVLPPTTDIELYKAKPVSTNVIYRMATDYGRLFERCRQLNNAQIMLSQQWTNGRRLMAKASQLTAAEKRPHINFGDPYNAIAKAGLRKLEILILFYQEHDVLEGRFVFIRKSILRTLGLDVARFGTRENIAREIADHANDTLKKLEILARFMPANKLKQAQEKQAFTRQSVQLLLAQNKVYIDVLGVTVPTLPHVLDGATSQPKSGQIIPFSKP